MNDRNEPASGPPHRMGHNRQRQRVLELVRMHSPAVDAAELAAQMGLHPTTVRFHLDALCNDGVVERTRIAGSGVGRPRTGYLAVRERLDYQILAEILALELGDTPDKRRRRAEAAGRRWARRISGDSTSEDVARQHASGDVETKEMLGTRAALIARVFARMGFGPELQPAASSNRATQQTIRLHSCPVRELARAHPEVGCALHQGLLQGLFADWAASERDPAASRPAIKAELEPFVEPELCLVRMTGHD
ncbi:helix-turn-helix transcriptional regulator [Mycobacterium kansasii]|uniref:helix-turn-helix transcriptional regulator n=1 Tax=Mycobacterium kansasii TaxID=1768 RepID=UPI000C085D73|nr:transcriptional regulator [Mycobacterium kansasii]